MDTFRERVAVELFKEACATNANREQCAIKAWRSAIALDAYRIAAQGSIKEFDDFVDKRKASVSRMYLKPQAEPAEPFRGFREAIEKLILQPQEAVNH
jgi:hypothetical protein